MKQRELPADVFDALELSAHIFGGIGAGKYWESGRGFQLNKNDTPYCAVGHAEFLGIEWALDSYDLTTTESDRAVIAINGQNSSDCHARVPFQEWCKEMHVVRGTT